MVIDYYLKDKSPNIMGDGFKFAYHADTNQWIIDVYFKLNLEEIIDLLKKYKNVLSQVDNISDLFIILDAKNEEKRMIEYNLI